ncbi:hypothetical protein BKA66DRAFT_464352 [Pyrenochaeta sp. MPI-SDFR-AT-0127]|nr:hypothetical protein BKA66DRAFT_464352 [Pyrenochaeta sp. MPI-SDFR-AT-0127]
MLLFYELPSFAFVDKRLNYAKASPAFLQNLRTREKMAIRHIYWPYRLASGVPSRRPDRKVQAAPRPKM